MQVGSLAHIQPIALLKKPHVTWGSSPNSLPPNTPTSTSHIGFHNGNRWLPQSSDVLIRFSLSKSGHLIYKQNWIWKLLSITAQHTAAHLTPYNHRVVTPGCSRHKHPLTMLEDAMFRHRRTSDQRSTDLLYCFHDRSGPDTWHFKPLGPPRACLFCTGFCSS